MMIDYKCHCFGYNCYCCYKLKESSAVAVAAVSIAIFVENKAAEFEEEG